MKTISNWKRENNWKDRENRPNIKYSLLFHVLTLSLSGIRGYFITEARIEFLKRKKGEGEGETTWEQEWILQNLGGKKMNGCCL